MNKKSWKKQNSFDCFMINYNMKTIDLIVFKFDFLAIIFIFQNFTKKIKLLTMLIELKLAVLL
jgi:hypothetical protein